MANTDHDEVRAGVRYILMKCPFLYAGNMPQLDDDNFDEEEHWENFENTGTLQGVPIRKWSELTLEEKAQLMEAVNQVWLGNEAPGFEFNRPDSTMAAHLFMYSIGAYPRNVEKPSVIENREWELEHKDFSDMNGHFQNLRNEFFSGGNRHFYQSSGWNSLMEAARVGNADRINELIAKNATVDMESTVKYHPTVQNGRVVNFKATEDASGRTVTPLLVAVRCGHAEAAQALIQGKADVNKKDSAGFSPLWYAVASPYIPADAQLKMTQSLVNAKADLGFKGPEGTTLLMQAARNGRADLTLYLLQQDACKASINEVDSQNHNALFYAVQGCASSERGLDVVKAMLGANAKIQQDTLDFINNPSSNVPAEVKQLVLDTYVKQEKVPALLEAVQKGDVATMNKLLNEDLASLSIDSFPIAADKTGSLLDYALDNSANKPAVIEALLARAGEDPTKPPQVTDEILAKAEQQASGGNADAVKVFNLIRDRYNAQHPVAENALEVALKANSGKGDMSAARRAISADLNGNQLGTLNKPSMMQAYFNMSAEYYKTTRNNDLKKTFENLAKYQRLADSATDPQKKAEATAKVQELLNGLKNDVAQYNALSSEERTAIDFIIENSKPKDKVQELRQAIASGRAEDIIKALESADGETLKTVSNDPALMASCYKVLGTHYKASSDENAKKLGNKYTALASLLEKVATETDETKKKELQGKIATALSELSGAEFQGAMSAGEKKMMPLLKEAFPTSTQTITTPVIDQPGVDTPVNWPPVNPGPQPVNPNFQPVNPVQAGNDIAHAKAEAEKTPWYKQEWLWWVLGIALAGALGFFAFRKGGWLNKDDKKTATVNTNTNDNSNSNTNTNTGNESGGTLDNSAQNITSAQLNDMLATGGRISRSSTDRA